MLEEFIPARAPSDNAEASVAVPGQVHANANNVDAKAQKSDLRDEQLSLDKSVQLTTVRDTLRTVVGTDGETAAAVPAAETHEPREEVVETPAKKLKKKRASHEPAPTPSTPSSKRVKPTEEAEKSTKKKKKQA